MLTVRITYRGFCLLYTSCLQSFLLHKKKVNLLKLLSLTDESSLMLTVWIACREQFDVNGMDSVPRAV